MNGGEQRNVLASGHSRGGDDEDDHEVGLAVQAEGAKLCVGLVYDRKKLLGRLLPPIHLGPVEDGFDRCIPKAGGGNGHGGRCGKIGQH